MIKRLYLLIKSFLLNPREDENKAILETINIVLRKLKTIKDKGNP